MTDDERKWRWFARIFRVREGFDPMPRDSRAKELFEWWKSGFDCGVIEEQNKRGHVEPSEKSDDWLDTFDRELCPDTIRLGDWFLSERSKGMVTWLDRDFVQIGIHRYRWSRVSGIWYAVSQNGGKTWRRII